MQLQTLISKDNPFKVTNSKGVKALVEKLLETEVEDITDEFINELDKSAKNTKKIAARKIADELNGFERRYPRKDPALEGLDTAQWRVYIYKMKPDPKGFVRTKGGQFGYHYRIQIWNMQRPFPYRFDFTNMEDPSWRGGKLLLNMPIESMTSREKTWALRRNGMLPNDGRLKKTKYGDFYEQSGQKDSSDRVKMVGARVSQKSNRSRYVGNLAAVRLSLATGIVKPVRAQRIVFWNNHRARRLDKSGNKISGRPYKEYGYVFVRSRRKTGKGHDWYYKKITEILNTGTNDWIDDIWQK